MDLMKSTIEGITMILSSLFLVVYKPSSKVVEGLSEQSRKTLQLVHKNRVTVVVSAIILTIFIILPELMYESMKNEIMQTFLVPLKNRFKIF